ncbi:MULTISPECIES: alpha/beta hydrolase family protein [Ramlibacter]|uniref:Alpha/beta hydrolase n=1 Tax=Ramlibacter pinisoli TaxID=2682844 RepID=A0A6N8IPS9_9BURK|nr:MULTISPECIES: dienelactone hydrolase family protein [Ramlibacter]MBA2963923.1 dienelactone hydrolase family protein [Ramlibacter sp. CGMCC 1.13660]MVQ28889.1 alpha/beta hydrolase [Ramlibacter pinisoli]
MNWNHASEEGGLRKRRFSVPVGGRRVPGVLWTSGAQGPRPLVLVGHGGSQHKEADAVLDVVGPLVRGRGFAVAAIDGPVHGERRADGGLDGAKVIQDFRALWSGESPCIDAMVADWRAALDELVRLPEIDAGAIGWFGISMGTAYGIPVCAADTRIRAALLGMWGTSHAHGERLLAEARKVQCPVLFQRKADDERFTPAGQEQLFDAIAGADKALRVHPGRHVNPAGAQLDEGLSFLARHLQPGAAA